ncbi:MAG: MBL fold metallo-hydrolase [Betaproteobacteria bacterium]|nr:MBL fold metallo-hydrolase [Betaproteobacteria bacterium]
MPPQIQVLERGWLSSNNILFDDSDGCALIDSGYVAHAAQTLLLLQHALDGKRLTRLINTHCHSDHMGGNAALQRAHGCRTSIPVGEAPAVAAWDDATLMLSYTGQSAERFSYDDTLSAGDRLRLGGLEWEALAAPGHDMHALMFYAPAARILISGDALWENGFGLIFSELFGHAGGFAAARVTLAAISRLQIDTVIPGHGAPFGNVERALETSFQRLDAYERDPTKLARHALKVMLSFSLMIQGRMALAELPQFLATRPIYGDINRRFLHLSEAELREYLLRDLERAGALKLEDGWLLAA